MTFFRELLNVLGCGTTSPRFKESTTLQERDDRQHFGARTEFEDWEKVGKVIAQYVPSYRNCVQPVLGPLAGVFRGLFWCEYLYIESLRVVLWQVRLDLLDQVGVMRASFAEPEYCGSPSGTSPTDSQSYPLSDRLILGLAHPPYITFGHGMVLRQSSHRPGPLVTVPDFGISKVLSCDPYSSAF